jgi:hypothetical protein
LSITDIARAIIHILAIATSLFVRIGALGIINLDTPAIVRCTSLHRFVESSRGRCTMRSRRWYLNEREKGIHECTSVFRACELGKPEALRDTFENPTVKETSMYAQK